MPDSSLVYSLNYVLSPEHWLGVPRQWHTNPSPAPGFPRRAAKKRPFPRRGCSSAQPRVAGNPATLGTTGTQPNSPVERIGPATPTDVAETETETTRNRGDRVGVRVLCPWQSAVSGAVKPPRCNRASVAVSAGPCVSMDRCARPPARVGRYPGVAGIPATPGCAAEKPLRGKLRDLVRRRGFAWRFPPGIGGCNRRRGLARHASVRGRSAGSAPHSTPLRFPAAACGAAPAS